MATALDAGMAHPRIQILLFLLIAAPACKGGGEAAREVLPLGSSGWVPTLQLTSYVHQRPEGEWLRARQWCVVITDGVVEERCELFDARDQLVATSSQLAMVRFGSRDAT